MLEKMYFYQNYLLACIEDQNEASSDSGLIMK